MLRHTRSFLGLVAMAGHEDVLDVAPRVRVPTTILWGRRDGTMPVDDAHRLASRMARANVQVGRGSHDRIVTRPRSVAAELVALPVRSLQR